MIQCCTRCDKEIKQGKEVWLELSLTDGEYYKDIPFNHESQGCFPFGSNCMKKQLIHTSSK